MYKLKSASLEWAILHLDRFYDSDFYPRLFEFDAIKNNWKAVKDFLLDLDLENYAPKVPLTTLAPKPRGTFRVVHQLEPIDSLIYTALVYENLEIIENARIPEFRNISCSYRIKADNLGSFFEKGNNGYLEFRKKAEALSEKFKNGHVLVCDIADFYNQIYLHRVSNLFSEIGSPTYNVLEKFLSGINNNISKGIPVGPAPSIIIAELIMSDIDNMILKYTENFTRYVDDIYLFFETSDEAFFILHQLTRFLYSNHRLTLSSEKTKILTSKDFTSYYLYDEESEEREAIHEAIEELDSGDYGEPEEVRDFEELESQEKVKVRAEAYKKLFIKALEFEDLQIGIIRHILRKAGRYNIRILVPVILNNFKVLLPALREVMIYFERVLNEKIVKKNAVLFNSLLVNDFIKFPYINIWIFTMLQNEVFNAIELKIDYKTIIRTREKALIARRLGDKTWIKENKDGLETLGEWDKRGCIKAATILSQDEMKHWLGIESSRGDILIKSVCNYSIRLKNDAENKMT